MKLAIGCTKAGLTLKAELVNFFTTQGHDVLDLGMKSDGPFVPYHEAAANVAGAVSGGCVDKAVIICGTGAGSVIVANKFKGVYAVHATNEYMAAKAAAINGANVLVLAEWLTPAPHALEIIKTWLSTPFGQGFEPDWVDFLKNAAQAIKSLEARNFQ